jgi:hypothetical protein
MLCSFEREREREFFIDVVFLLESERERERECVDGIRESVPPPSQDGMFYKGGFF